MTSPITYEMQQEAVSIILTRAPFLSAQFVDKVVRTVVTVLESHIVEDIHITKPLKEIGGYPVEWESRPCYVFQQAKKD